MKYMKMLGLLAVAASVLMAFAAPVSATELTSPKGTKLPVGTVVKAESAGSVTLDGTINITCKKATGEGKITNAGGPGATVSGLPNLAVFTECGNHTVTVLSTGSGEIHSVGSNTGTMFSTGAEITVLTHSLFLGTRHCIYATNNTHVGTAEGSEYAGNTTARVILNGAPIPQKATDSLCGNDATITGTVVATSPDPIYID